jgi:hypothetical protein
VAMGPCCTYGPRWSSTSGRFGMGEATTWKTSSLAGLGEFSVPLSRKNSSTSDTSPKRLARNELSDFSAL